ncbi:MAG: polyketide cyclase, partial [Pyrinomonadaceae bacterium]
WGSVYHSVEIIEPGDENNIGKLIKLRASGWLPYTLKINFRTVESNSPHGFKMTATGDLEGVGIWTFEQDDDQVDVTYDWTVLANKPIVRKLTFLLKPIFQGNHNWTMRRGEESLKLELLRRRAATEAERMAIPPPPKRFLLFRFMK